MTRGRLYLIAGEERCYYSIQFLSDMYPQLPNGHGSEIIAAYLRRQIVDEETMEAFVRDKHMEWDPEDVRDVDDDELVTGTAYPIVIRDVFDDYSYILNCSDRESGAVIAGREVMIGRDEMMVVHYADVEQRIRRSDDGLIMHLQDKEVTTCINALDFYARIFTGQYDRIDKTLAWAAEEPKAFRKNGITRERLYEAARSRVFQGTFLENESFSASFGIWTEETDERGVIAYEILQVIRNKAAWVKNPKGGFSIDYDDPVIKSLQPEASCTCWMEGEVLRQELFLNSTQADILCKALEVSYLLYSVRLRNLFAHYTDDEIVIDIVGIAEKLYRGIGFSNEYRDQIVTVWKKALLIGKAT